MQKTFNIMLTFVVCAASYTSLFAKDGVCFHCEEIREYNRAHPQKEQYYEDYLKEHPELTAELDKQIRAHFGMETKTEPAAQEQPTS